MTFWNFFFLILIFIPLTILWVFTLIDLAKRDDVSGLAKALWAIAIVFLPLIGMVIYFITRPDDSPMPKDPATRYAEDQAATLSDERIAQIQQLGQLHDAGTITDEEFSTMKSRILS